MDERPIHRLRNELNVISVGLIALKRRLTAEQAQEMQPTLERVSLALARCADLVATPPADTQTRIEQD
ncbi:hypothetical protein [Xanthomonas sp. XNM01]|jgi:hypothetical protein|uniref:hypothetical protein n=1 Tax=Xanthomonas sp. XNM01 TaxID=2769289 RepID=UPI001786CE05|nr:hypothetical protein [Xanthomonas sp. XNM01]MBD9370694.1 hypothetical protein [Xanthomonas sp. XNM01]